MELRLANGAIVPKLEWKKVGGWKEKEKRKGGEKEGRGCG